ncbi:sugar ABC transporter ATP-binding protein [Streptomyces sp. NPDC005393]|uniref:sugar ABC transporter ATP-binding protein n=1 Tax=Streptomyces sp. NPDC005393 TaxID=3157041 RepID=UPI0033AAFDB8
MAPVSTTGEAEGGHTVPLLALRGIEKHYQGVYALRGVDFEIRPGEVHALLGSNGAGKSTLIKVIAGAVQPDGGDIRRLDEPVRITGAQAAFKLGIATVYQEPHVFAELSVLENVFAGRELRTRFGGVDWTGQRSRVRELLDGLRMDPDLADARMSDLTVGRQQLVSIAKALVHEAQILIFDEPSAILSDQETQDLFEVITRLRADGVGIVYISHRLGEVFTIADRATVMRDGQVVASAPVSELTESEIARLMAGRALAGLSQEPRPAPGKPVLRTNRLGRAGAFRDVDITVRAGEILGLYGLIGSGADELAQCLYGIAPADTGEVHLHGERITVRSTADAAKRGIALLPRDRKAQGIFGPQSIAYNISIAHLGELRRLGVVVDRSREKSIAADFLRRLAIKAPDVSTPTSALSGGNAQKVVLARQLVRRPELLLLEEPTQGVDVAAKEEIHRIILELAAEGTAVIVVSTDLPEVMALADHVVVMQDGAVRRTFDRGAQSADVLQAAIGTVREEDTTA